mmetsp:Transcript_3015/g.3895  ORF Transcript_3015/g.3895 Transcript_3015/m.3895 type:complete len:306 (-) Transcript_3015:317-1234(-)
MFQMCVDFTTAVAATAAKGHGWEDYSWDDRNIRQGFLRDQILDWCGDSVREIAKRGHNPVTHPTMTTVCVGGAIVRSTDDDGVPERTTTMSVVIKSLPPPGLWKETWYCSWKSRQNNTNRLIHQVETEDDYEPAAFTCPHLEERRDNKTLDDEPPLSRIRRDRQSQVTTLAAAAAAAATSPRRAQSSPSSSPNKKKDDDNHRPAKIHEAEIGMLCTKRLEIGERVTRVHYTLTTSLRKSRWTKKYFPDGTYPYAFRDERNVMRNNLSSSHLIVTNIRTVAAAATAAMTGRKKTVKWSRRSDYYMC